MIFIMKLKKSSGQVTISERLTVKVACAMKFRYFPFDFQYCPLYMESFAYRSNQLDLQWDWENPIQASDFRTELSRFHTG